MGVIRTDQWLREMYSSPISLCKKLTKYFPEGTSGEEIYQYLQAQGMYKPLYSRERDPLETLPKEVWDIVSNEEKRLKQGWKGPNIPIFIFPSDELNRKIKAELNGKSGLAFKDKLFLFFSSANSEDEIKAVLTHEYNHVCRLTKYKKKEQEYTLLDTIILEGLAENAVRERCGTNQVAAWTSYYTENQAERLWKHVVSPHLSVSKSDRLHHQILFGTGFYPKMVGYCTGYYVVKNYLEKNKLQTIDILGIPSEQIIK